MVHFLRCSSRAQMPPLGPLVFSILLLLISSTGTTTFSDARRLPPVRRHLLENDSIKGQEASPAEITGEGAMMERRRSLIGSRPPRCERVCMSCGHCEAVQVPIVPQEHRRKRASAHREQVLSAAAAGAAMFSSSSNRVSSITNYKPLSWKCRCGGAILDP